MERQLAFEHSVAPNWWATKHRYRPQRTSVSSHGSHQKFALSLDHTVSEEVHVHTSIWPQETKLPENSAIAFTAMICL